MKFNCGASEAVKRKSHKEHCEERIKELKQWRKVFALWPIRVGENDCRWLEYVEVRYPSARYGHNALSGEYGIIWDIPEHRAIDRE